MMTCKRAYRGTAVCDIFLNCTLTWFMASSCESNGNEAKCYICVESNNEVPKTFSTNAVTSRDDR